MEKELIEKIDMLKERFGDINIKTVEMDQRSNKLIIGFDSEDGHNLEFEKTKDGFNIMPERREPKWVIESK